MNWRNLIVSLASLALSAWLMMRMTSGGFQQWMSWGLGITSGLLLLNLIVGWISVLRHWMAQRLPPPIDTGDDHRTDPIPLPSDLKEKAAKTRRRLGAGGNRIPSRGEAMDNMRKAMRRLPPHDPQPPRSE